MKQFIPYVFRAILSQVIITVFNTNIVNIISETIVEQQVAVIDYWGVLIKNNCITSNGKISDDIIISAFNHLKYHWSYLLQFLAEGRVSCL